MLKNDKNFYVKPANTKPYWILSKYCRYKIMVSYLQEVLRTMYMILKQTYVPVSPIGIGMFTIKYAFIKRSFPSTIQSTG